MGVCHGVIARIAPDARVIDLTHGVPRHAIRSGALALRRALPFTPPGVHVAVVDPGVGGPRRGGRAAVRGSPARRARQRPAHAGRGAPRRRRGGRRPRVVAVAAGAGVGDVPRPRRVRPGRGASRPRRAARATPGSRWRRRARAPWRCRSRTARASRSSPTRWRSTPTGTCCSTPPAATCPPGERVEVAGRWVARGRTFGDVPDGELLLYEDSSGALALAVNGGSARDELDLRLDDEVRIA